MLAVVSFPRLAYSTTPIPQLALAFLCLRTALCRTPNCNTYVLWWANVIGLHVTLVQLPWHFNPYVHC